eukprot:SAG31_NODE_53_length_30139_cov_31.002197_11_plen_126_part_00
MASSEKPGVYLKWEGVCYDVDDKHSDVKGSQKRILHDVFGFAAPGEMLAIMGPSGCGKSSLLNALAQRRKSEDGITGTIQINGASVPSNFNRLSGYVTQVCRAMISDVHELLCLRPPRILHRVAI